MTAQRGREGSGKKDFEGIWEEEKAEERIEGARSEISLIGFFKSGGKFLPPIFIYITAKLSSTPRPRLKNSSVTTRGVKRVDLVWSRPVNLKSAHTAPEPA